MIMPNVRMLFLIPILLSIIAIGYFSYANIDYSNHNRVVTCDIDSCKIKSITQDPPRYMASISYSISIFDRRYSNGGVLQVPDSGFCNLKTIECVYNEYYMGNNPESRDILSLNGQNSLLYTLMLILSLIIFTVTSITWCTIKLEEIKAKDVD